MKIVQNLSTTTCLDWIRLNNRMKIYNTISNVLKNCRKIICGQIKINSGFKPHYINVNVQFLTFQKPLFLFVSDFFICNKICSPTFRNWTSFWVKIYKALKNYFKYFKISSKLGCIIYSEIYLICLGRDTESGIKLTTATVDFCLATLQKWSGEVDVLTTSCDILIANIKRGGPKIWLQYRRACSFCFNV